MRTLKRLILLIGVLTIIALFCNVYGTTSISTSASTVNVGDTITANVNVSGVATWQLNVTYSNLQLVSGSTTLVRSDNGIENVSRIAGTLTFKATTAGSASINVTGNSYTEDGVTSNSNATKTITVVTPAPQTPSTQTPTTQTPTTTVTTPNKTTTATTTNKTNTTKSTQIASNNAYLKEFRVNVEGISPEFSKYVYNYSLNIGNDVNNIDVTAVSEDSNASVSISGNTDLKQGENTIYVKVVAQDNKTTNTYTIKVIKSANPILANAYLLSLVISNAKLNPDFVKETFDYTCESVSYNIDKLDITTFPENENATVKIEGNENLKVGENNIKIIVTSEDKSIENTYNIKVVKEEQIMSGKTNEKTVKTNELWNIVKENATVILLYFFVWLEVFQVAYMYEKYVKIEKV